MTRVLLADDHALLREGVRLLLERSGFEVVGEASDGAQAVELTASLAPDVLVLDMSMPKLNGVEAARLIRHGNPSVKMVLLTMHRDEGELLEALRAGVNGCVLKEHAAQELVHAIRETARGAFYLAPDIPGTIIQALADNTRLASQSLSPREKEVVKLIAEGKSNREIAAQLLLSPKTVESHRSRIMQKLSINQTAQLVCYAVREHLIKA